MTCEYEGDGAGKRREFEGIRSENTGHHFGINKSLSFEDVAAILVYL